MKKGLCVVMMVFTVLFVCSTARAVTIGFNPVSQTVGIGSAVTVELYIYGYAFGQDIALKAYDLDINFDSTVLSFIGLSAGSSLGTSSEAPMNYSSLISGTLNISQLSSLLNEALYALQPQAWPDDHFVLATLTFSTLQAGTSVLEISINDLVSTTADGKFDYNYTDQGSISAVPLPATLLLLGPCFLGLIGIRRKIGN